jgi:hypothetical protein
MENGSSRVSGDGWLGGENGLFRRNRREGGFTLFKLLCPAGRARYARGGHFVACVSCLGWVICLALPLVGIKFGFFVFSAAGR